MAGKALPCMFVGVIQATSILLVAQLWFRIPFAGSFLTLYAGLSLFLLAAVGMGLLVSSVVATMQQAMLFAFVLVMPFALLSGLTTPVSNMPPVLQYFTLINPLRYALDITHRVYLEGAGLSQLMPELWPLALIGAITLTAASWMFRNHLTIAATSFVASTHQIGLRISEGILVEARGIEPPKRLADTGKVLILQQINKFRRFSGVSRDCRIFHKFPPKLACISQAPLLMSRVRKQLRSGG